jgi:hypothetical protein
VRGAGKVVPSFQSIFNAVAIMSAPWFFKSVIVYLSIRRTKGLAKDTSLADFY